MSLKRMGHELLREYVALDMSKNVPKVKVRDAYSTIEKKIRFSKNNHFGPMTKEEEVIEVNNILKQMIEKRKKDNEHRGLNKNQVAPNVRELQQRAHLLNPGLSA